MPKKRQQPPAAKPKHCTHEAESYVQGAYEELRAEQQRYLNLIQLLQQTEARINLTEQKICLTRDHLQLTLAECKDAIQPRNWDRTFAAIRFVGVRLGDACMMLLSEHKSLTTEQLRHNLDHGMFRFRTAAPFREIHAAMIQQRGAEKVGEKWVWRGGGEKQIALRMRRPERLTTIAPTEESRIKAKAS
jgi:hypothetical protein